MTKPILVLDFDGVCHSYTSGWQGADVILDPPVSGLFEFLEEAKEHFEINIFSSRSNQPGGIDAMKVWLDYHWCVYNGLEYETTEMTDGNNPVSFIKFPKTKPAAFVSIDDRAITFTGTWPEMETLINFKPWNK